MKSRLAEAQTGVEPLFFHMQADFQRQCPFSKGCCGWILEKLKKNLSQSYGRWIVGFSRTNDQRLFALKKGDGIGGMILVCADDWHRELHLQAAVRLPRLPNQPLFRCDRTSVQAREDASGKLRRRGQFHCTTTIALLYKKITLIQIDIYRENDRL